MLGLKLNRVRKRDQRHIFFSDYIFCIIFSYVSSTEPFSHYVRLFYWILLTLLNRKCGPFLVTVFCVLFCSLRCINLPFSSFSAVIYMTVAGNIPYQITQDRCWLLISRNRDPKDCNQSYAANTYWLTENVCPVAVMCYWLSKWNAGWTGDNDLVEGKWMLNKEIMYVFTT